MPAVGAGIPDSSRAAAASSVIKRQASDGDGKKDFKISSIYGLLLFVLMVAIYAVSRERHGLQAARQIGFALVQIIRFHASVQMVQLAAREGIKGSIARKVWICSKLRRKQQTLFKFTSISAVGDRILVRRFMTRTIVSLCSLGLLLRWKRKRGQRGEIFPADPHADSMGWRTLAHLPSGKTFENRYPTWQHRLAARSKTLAFDAFGKGPIVCSHHYLEWLRPIQKPHESTATQCSTPKGHARRTARSTH